MSKVNPRKVAMIGCGFVGSASCFALMQSGLFSEMVLIDANQAKAEGEAMDIAHGLPFARPMNIYAGTYDDIADAAIIIVSAGAAQAPGETRLDLVKKNIRIFGFIMPELKKRDIGGVLVIVANPVDVLTYAAIQMSGLPENRVFGTGTVLDSARLKTTPATATPMSSASTATARSSHGAVPRSPVSRWSTTACSKTSRTIKSRRS